MTAARGIRNRNPGNIEDGRFTQGRPGYAGPEPEGRFARFETMGHGIAALIALLRIYRKQHNLTTVRGIINRWAPPSENVTSAYVTAVCDGWVLPDEELPNTPETYLFLAQRIARHECGPDAAQITPSDWEAGLALAGFPIPTLTETIEVAQPAQPQKEKPVGPAAILAKPFIVAAAQSLVEAIPWLMRKLNGDSKTTERNAEILEKVGPVIVNVAKEAIGATNEQDLVQRLADPAAVEMVSAALEANWFQIHEAREKSVAEARAFAVAYSENRNVRTVVGNLTFIELLALLMVVLSSTGAGYVLAGNFSADLKATVVTMIVVGGFVGIKEFFYGSSRGSDNKTDLLERQRHQQ